MKRKVLAAFLLATALTVSACSGSGSDGKDSGAKTEASDTKDAGYVFENNGAKVAIDEKAEDAVADLGDPVLQNEMPTCAMGDLDKMYQYNDFYLVSYQEDKVDYIYDIILTSDAVSTAEGVSIGDPAEKVKDVYGDAQVEDKQQIKYHKGNTNLTFILSEGKVLSIEYKTDKLDD